MQEKQLIRKQTIEKLRSFGMYLHEGGFGYDPIPGMFGRRPIFAIWHQSEEPTREEVGILRGIVARKISRWNPEYVKDFTVYGANMVTLNKEGGLWMFRRITWSSGATWTEAKPLAELKEDI
jgi:hypothetical protein